AHRGTQLGAPRGSGFVADGGSKSGQGERGQGSRGQGESREREWKKGPMTDGLDERRRFSCETTNRTPAGDVRFVPDSFTFTRGRTDRHGFRGRSTCEIGGRPFGRRIPQEHAVTGSDAPSRS